MSESFCASVHVTTVRTECSVLQGVGHKFGFGIAVELGNLSGVRICTPGLLRIGNGKKESGFTFIRG
jgi:hypothetical protein